MMLWLLVLSLQCCLADGFFDWLKDPAPAIQSEPSVPVLPDKPPTFEMNVVDEKFLAESKLLEISPLDKCHLTVVAKLKTSCSGLSEEELAKLGVALFNCLSEVEGRRTYLCQEHMTIKECTADMDANAWNAYHIVSNRARSVCYATRQQHFRRRAELTVNALIATATSQLDAMEDLKEGQKELREMTSASLDKLLEGHSALQSQQGVLRDGQEKLDVSISHNLQRLAQEKALISTGQQLVAQLIQGITQQMENVSERLKHQASAVEGGNSAILHDMAVVRRSAQDIHNKMEQSLNGVLQQQSTTAHFYSELTGKLERINGTLGHVLAHLESVHQRLEERLQMIQGYLGWAGLSLCALWTCVTHASYFLLSAVLLSFLRSSTFSRLSLLLTVPINAAAEIHQQCGLDLLSLTLLLLTLSLGCWSVQQVFRGICTLRRHITRPSSLSHGPLKVTHQSQCSTGSFTPYRDNQAEDGGFMLAEESLIPTSHSSPNDRRPPTHTHDHSTPKLKIRHLIKEEVESIPKKNFGGLSVLNDTRGLSPNSSLTSFSSLSGRPLCRGVTRLGQPCKKKVVLGQEYCHIHEGGCTSFNLL